MLSRAALLALCLCLCLPAIRADICADAAEVTIGAPGQWAILPEGSVPEEVANVTLAAFETAFVAGMSEEADALEADERWVACPAGELQYGAEGCLAPAPGGGVDYQLRFNLSCAAAGFSDAAVFEAAVAVNAAGEAAVNITSVDLELDPARLQALPCLDPYCDECSDVAEGADLANITLPTDAQSCDVCASNYTQDWQGLCVPEADVPEISLGEGAAFAAQPAAPSGYCGDTAYISGRDSNGNLICSRCTRQGCVEKGCRACNADEAFPFCRNGQVCDKGCDLGWFSDLNGGCTQCGDPNEGIPRCTQCFRCAGGQGCVTVRTGKLFCETCAAGFRKSGDGTGLCIPINLCDDVIAGCATCVDCPQPGSRLCHGGKQCTSCKPKFEFAGDGTARCRQLPLN